MDLYRSMIGLLSRFISVRKVFLGWGRTFSQLSEPSFHLSGNNFYLRKKICSVGLTVGCCVGASVGLDVGSFVGTLVGLDVGLCVVSV